MTSRELDDVFSLQTVAIVAPAGHGKTEMIVDMVERASGRQLLLTHTHAGVDALQKRLDRRNISKSKYTISTIAAFCIRWGLSYYNTAKVDLLLSPYNSSSNNYYTQFYNGAKTIFLHEWPKRVLEASYAGIIVDEYQDCQQIHHEMFQALSRYLPVRVLGDPLQGIFAFSGQKIVDWDNLGFPVIEIDTSPWRWIHTNPALGRYLCNIRKNLLPTLSGRECTISIDCNDSVQIIPPNAFSLYSLRDEFRNYKSVLYITKWEQQQGRFCLQYPGIFQYDEKQDSKELFEHANILSSQSGAGLMQAVIDFEKICATNVMSELKSYYDRLAKNNYSFAKITKKVSFGQLLLDLQKSDRYEIILRILKWFETDTSFKCYRKELHSEMIRSVYYAKEHSISILDAAMRIRRDPTLQKRYQGFKFLSSRTLLSKGLEFDCVIIDMSTPLTAKEFYVAMTRAMKKIYILSSSNVLTLMPN